MKKNIIFCLAAVLPMLLSCAKENLVEPETSYSRNLSGLEFTATFVQYDDTKTSLDSDGTTVKWSPSDSIAIVPVKNDWGIKSAPAHMSKMSKDAKTAIFVLPDQAHPIVPAFAVTPYTITPGESLIGQYGTVEDSEKKVNIIIPKTQSGAFDKANIAVAKCMAGNLSFKNAVGIFKLRFKAPEGKLLVISGTGIVGEVVAEYDGWKINFSGGSAQSNILVSADIDAGVEYYYAVRPGTYTDISFTLKEPTMGNEIFTVKYPKSLTVKPGMIVDWGELDGHEVAYLPGGSSFNSKLHSLAGSSPIRYVDFVTDAKDPIASGEKIFDDACIPVYAKYNDGRITIRTSASSFEARSGLTEGMASWFSGISALREVNGLDKINTSYVQTMDHMFSGCTNLEKVDMSKISTPRLRVAAAMFQGCEKLESLDISSFNTDLVDDMKWMFMNCESLKSLDLSSFNTSAVKSFPQMFAGTVKLKELKLGDKFTICDEAATQSPGIFGSGSRMMGSQAGTDPYANIICTDDTWSKLSEIVGANIKHYSRWTVSSLPSGADFNSRILGLGGDVVSLTFKGGDNSTGGTVINAGRKGSPIYAKNSGGSVTVWTSADLMWLDADCSGMFDELSDMTSISGLNCLLADNVTTMASMFDNCCSLTSIPVLSWKAPKLKSTARMFANCENLATILDLSSLSTSSLSDMTEMFYCCPALTGIYGLSDWNTSGVTSMKNLFRGCTELTNPSPLGGWDTGSVTDMSGMFEGCCAMTDFAFLPHWDTGSCTDMSYMLSAVGASYLDVSAFNTSKVTSMKGMFSWTDVNSINVSYFNTSNVTDMSEMFAYCMQLESLSLNKFDTRKVTDFTEMFCGCIRLSNLNMRGADFEIAPSATLTSIFGEHGNNYMGKENGVPYATVMISAANYKKVAAAIGDVTNFYVYQLPAYMPKGTQMQTLIGNLSRSKKIYPTSINFYILDVRSTSGAVLCNEGCSDLPIYMSLSSTGKLDIWTPGNFFVFDADSKSMFHSTPTVGDEGACCHKVKTITGMDNWETIRATSMETMFYNCQSLESCNLEYLHTDNVTTMAGMFGGCYKLTSPFVATWTTSKVTNMSRMFYNCVGLTSIELNTFDTSNVTTMASMFAGCYRLQSVNILKFDTGKVTTMASMFNGCTQLAGINIGSKFVFADKTTSYMFYNLGSSNSTPRCTFSCYDWQKTAITGILGADASKYAFTIKK